MFGVRRQRALALLGHLNRSRRTLTSISRSVPQRAIGQPTCVTHPHLVAEGEIMPGIPAIKYEERRTALIAALPNNSIAIFPANPTQIMSADIPYAYRQNTEMTYLCGFQEPQSIAAFVKGDNDKGAFFLFVPPRDEHSELWNGSCAGIDGAGMFGSDEIYPINEATEKICLLAMKADTVVFDPSVNRELTAQLHQYLHAYVKQPNKKLVHPDTIMHGLRAVKDPFELATMEKAAQISKAAFEEAMKFTKPGLSESAIEAKLSFECQVRGAKRLAYPPVVAAGNNATTLHYVYNNQLLRENDLLLVDGGAELHGYASDITRTWPVSGSFSKPQRQIYSLVLHTLEECLEVLSKGERELSLNALHIIAQRELSRGLRDLGIAKTERDVGKLFPHMIGHYLGMDTHDVGTLSKRATLVPGMVITIEPGLYLPHEEWIPSEYRGIGIRIEDNIIIGERGSDLINLTASVPKKIEDIEAIVGRE